MIDTNTNRETLVDHRPRGLLQDAGEVTVVTPRNRRVRHRHALVIAFDDERELAAAVEQCGCQYLTSDGAGSAA
jgi:hypothetical protein